MELPDKVFDNNKGCDNSIIENNMSISSTTSTSTTTSTALMVTPAAAAAPPPPVSRKYGNTVNKIYGHKNEPHFLFHPMLARNDETLPALKEEVVLEILERKRGEKIPTPDQGEFEKLGSPATSYEKRPNFSRRKSMMMSLMKKNSNDDSKEDDDVKSNSSSMEIEEEIELVKKMSVKLTILEAAEKRRQIPAPVPIAAPPPLPLVGTVVAVVPAPPALPPNPSPVVAAAADATTVSSYKVVKRNSGALSKRRRTNGNERKQKP